MEEWEKRCGIIRRWSGVWRVGWDRYSIRVPEEGWNRSWGAVNVELHCDLNDVNPNNLSPPDFLLLRVLENRGGNL